MSEAWRLGLRNNIYKKGKEHHKSLKINQYDLEGNFIKQWDCIKEGARQLNIQHANIIACAKGRRSVAGRF